LRLRRKADAVKIELAAQLRRETRMTLKWIAQRLQLGAWTHLNRTTLRAPKEEWEELMKIRTDTLAVTQLRSPAQR